VAGEVVVVVVWRGAAYEGGFKKKYYIVEGSYWYNLLSSPILCTYLLTSTGKPEMPTGGHISLSLKLKTLIGKCRTPKLWVMDNIFDSKLPIFTKNPFSPYCRLDRKRITF
jgi:hypothetical protein